MLAYRALLPGGKFTVAFINTGTTSAETVTFDAPLSGTLRTWAYSAANQKSTNSAIVTGTASAASVAAGITLPAGSMTILQTR